MPEIKFSTEIWSEGYDELSADQSLFVSGQLIQSGWIPSKKLFVPPEELDSIQASAVGVPITGDHKKSIFATVGRVTGTSKVGDKVFFEGKIIDSKIQGLIREQIIDSVSPGLEVTKLECSICGKDLNSCNHRAGSTYNGKMCYGVARGIKVKELSIVLYPAQKSNKFGVALGELVEAINDYKDGVFGLPIPEPSEEAASTLYDFEREIDRYKDLSPLGKKILREFEEGAKPKPSRLVSGIGEKLSEFEDKHGPYEEPSEEYKHAKAKMRKRLERMGW